MNRLRFWCRAFAAILVAIPVIVAGLISTPGAAAAAGGSPINVGTWTVQSRATKHLWVNDATADAYATGLEASAVDPQGFCMVELSRTWYERESSGEREFHLNIKGDNSKACEVTVWLVPLASYRTSGPRQLAPGASWSTHWNNAHTQRSVYLVGVVGSQPTSGTCRMEVATHYRTQPDGENEFYYTTTNIGTVACSAELRHVELPVAWSRQANLWDVDPGSGVNMSPNRFSETAKVFVPGAAPIATAAGTCRFDLGPTAFGSRFWVDYTNTGSVPCGVISTWAAL